MKWDSARWGTLATSFLAVLSFSRAEDEGWTLKHEKGRCAIRGHCGKQGFFGRDLPCPDNGLAEEPESEVRKQLISICGDSWSDSKVCCNKDQVPL
jgi:Niemann-Pick C1 protein